MNTIILTLLINNCSPGAVPAKELAPAIIKVAKHEHIDAVLLAKVIITESGCKETAVNLQSMDFGLMQLNVKTIVENKLTVECVRSWRCNLEAGAKILKKAIKGHRPCAYNLGRTGAFRYKNACLKYEEKLASIN